MPGLGSSFRRARRLLPLWEGRAVLVTVGLGLAVLVAAISIASPVLLEQADLRLYDRMSEGRIAPPRSGVAVLVGIDEESLRAYGQWPWPRYRLARLVEKLYGLGAEVVTLDLLMSEPDRTSPGVIVTERLRDGEADTPFIRTFFPDENSGRLAQAMSRGKAALGYLFDFGGGGGDRLADKPVLPSGLVVVQGAGAESGWPRPVGAIRAIPELVVAASAEGFTNALHDRDGILRRLPLLLPHEEGLYPSLALASLLLHGEDRNLQLSKRSEETMLEWNGRTIPLDRGGNLLLDFRDEQRSFTYLSAGAVLEGRAPAGSLKGRIALVGPWAKGLGDEHLVPSGRSMYGLAVHATVIDNLLSGTFIHRPGWARGAEVLAILLLGLACSWLYSRTGVLLSLAVSAVGTVGSYLGCRQMLVDQGLYLSPLLPMATPVVILAVLSLLKYGIEARKVRQRTQDLIEAQDTIILSMSALTETRDKETGGHILRTQRYVEILARELARLPRYSDLDETSIELLTKSAPLHDIGKVGIPDSILHKPGHLTENEYDAMKSHTLIGVQALARTIGGTEHPEKHDFLHYARQMIESHHERWDGSGYPHGLRGLEIPLAGRLMALADVYDALVSQRVYKAGFTYEQARTLIQQSSGKHFDPDVVNAFLARSEDFLRVSRELSDEVVRSTTVAGSLNPSHQTR